MGGASKAGFSLSDSKFSGTTIFRAVKIVFRRAQPEDELLTLWYFFRFLLNFLLDSARGFWAKRRKEMDGRKGFGNLLSVGGGYIYLWGGRSLAVEGKLTNFQHFGLLG